MQKKFQEGNTGEGTLRRQPSSGAQTTPKHGRGDLPFVTPG
jgi:hypothetical protein